MTRWRGLPNLRPTKFNSRPMRCSQGFMHQSTLVIVLRGIEETKYAGTLLACENAVARAWEYQQKAVAS